MPNGMVFANILINWQMALARAEAGESESLDEAGSGEEMALSGGVDKFVKYGDMVLKVTCNVYEPFFATFVATAMDSKDGMLLQDVANSHGSFSFNYDLRKKVLDYYKEEICLR